MTDEKQAQVRNELETTFWEGQPQATIGECLDAIATWHLAALTAERERCLEAKPHERSWRTVGEAPFVRGYNRALAEWAAAIRALEP